MKRNSLFFSGLTLNLLALILFPLVSNAQIINASNFESRNNLSKTKVDISSLEYRVFELVNQKRAENGLDFLVWSEQAAAAARIHSSNMASFDFFSHIGLDGKQVDGRADSLGLRKWRMIGENIAFNYGFNDPVERAIYSWMQSPGHRKNILRSNWKETGIGISISSKGKYYITQVFLQRK